MATHRSSRPSALDRYKGFRDISSLNDLINILEIAYEEDRNEKVYRAIKKLKQIKSNALDDFWNMEKLYREDELREFWENPGAFPYSVRVWIMELLKEENA